MQQPPTFPPSSQTTTAGQAPRPNGPTSGGPAAKNQTHFVKPVNTSAVGHALADRAEGVSPPALLGYATAGLIMLFGAGGTLFSDLPGEIKKGLVGGYAAGSVGLVLLSSFVDSHHRISQRGL